jgi:hypothetical protein
MLSPHTSPDIITKLGISMSHFSAHKCLAFALVFSAFALTASKAPLKATTQVGTPATSAANLPPDTLIFAQLVTELDSAQCKAGDHVEAEITHEVKVGHDTVFRRGSRVIGQVVKAAGPDASGLYGVLIIFDTVVAKDGAVETLKMDVQAISTPETGDTNGVGPALPSNPGATEGPHGELTSRSRGVVNLPGVTLASGNANGKRITILTSKKGNIRLTKRSQVVFRTVNL